MHSKSAKTKKRAPIVLRWQSELFRCGDLPTDNPSPQAVVAVAAVLVTLADADGRNCRPSIETIMRLAHASKRTVKMALGWLVAHRWLAVTRQSRTRPTVYRLMLAGGAEEHPQENAPGVPTGTTNCKAGGADGGADGGAVEHPDLRPPTPPEEEGGGVLSLSSANAPVAAPLSTVPHELLAGDGQQSSGGTLDPEASGAALELSGFLSESIDAAVIRTGWHSAKAITGWSYRMLLAYIGPKVKQQRNVRDPSRWIATDLSTRVSAACQPTPRMAYAAALDELDVVARQVWQKDPDACCPRDVFVDLLREHRMLPGDSGEPPEPLELDGDAWMRQAADLADDAPAEAAARTTAQREYEAQQLEYEAQRREREAERERKRAEAEEGAHREEVMRDVLARMETREEELPRHLTRVPLDVLLADQNHEEPVLAVSIADLFPPEPA